MTEPVAPLPIALQGLVFRPNGHPVLDGLSATIVTQGVTAIIGPNGAGKSVTLRVVDGLLRPDRGTVRFGGRPAQAVRRAFVFQRPALIRASVADNVALALLPFGLSRRGTADRVAAALARVGLADRANAAARKLSAGEQQRMALARAWVVEPELLLLDEPTANLDPGATEAVESLIAGMAQAGTKVILVSHNLGQVARLAEDVLVLADGRAVEHGPTRRVLDAPHAPGTRLYLRGELPCMPYAVAS